MRKDCKLKGVLAKAVSMYNGGLSTVEIGEYFGIDPSNVYRVFKSHGVKMRNQKEGIRNAFLTGRAKIITGEKNHAWRGGKTHHSKGYILVKKPEHPRADKRGYVQESILIAEKMLGRLLAKLEIVHHKDLDKTNNEPSNLEVLSGKSKHQKVHAAMRGGKIGKNYIGRPAR